ncbi:hypothetical protein [Vaginella massiliensis]|uniref:hypothetical protein n=1 Tax=Vaginella massiliensis TaxID=1816680 RepID=UPI000839839F|nr:hypothetical protein [Vaginella massiliensis]
MRKYIIFLIFAVSVGFLSTLSSCENNTENNCVPHTIISKVLNLNLPLYSPLQNPGGWVYVDGEGAGTRGLVVINTGANRFMVYDRNAPHMCPRENSTLVVVDDIKLYCPQDEAEWNLFTGEPIKIANRPPTMYRAVYQGNNTLVIER